MGQYIQTLTLNQRTVTSTSTISLLTPYTVRPQYHIVKHEGLGGFAHQKRISKRMFLI